MTGLRVSLVVATVAAVLAACGAGEDDGTAGTATTRPSTPRLAERCTNAATGLVVAYPKGWHTNEPAESPACRYFHPEPFDVPVATEDLAIAISIRVVAEPYHRVRHRLAHPGPAEEVLASLPTSVARRPAVTALVRATSEAALVPPVTRAYHYAVDLDGGTLLAATHEGAAAGTFASNRAVLDHMMANVQVRSPACSAAFLDGETAPQRGLPEAVAETRGDIVAAAVSCYLDRLGQLAREGGDPVHAQLRWRGQRGGILAGGAGAGRAAAADTRPAAPRPPWHPRRGRLHPVRLAVGIRL